MTLLTTGGRRVDAPQCTHGAHVGHAAGGGPHRAGCAPREGAAAERDERAITWPDVPDKHRHGGGGEDGGHQTAPGTIVARGMRAGVRTARHAPPRAHAATAEVLRVAWVCWVSVRVLREGESGRCESLLSNNYHSINKVGDPYRFVKEKTVIGMHGKVYTAGPARARAPVAACVPRVGSATTGQPQPAATVEERSYWGGEAALR